MGFPQQSAGCCLCLLSCCPSACKRLLVSHTALSPRSPSHAAKPAATSPRLAHTWPASARSHAGGIREVTGPSPSGDLRQGLAATAGGAVG